MQTMNIRSQEASNETSKLIYNANVITNKRSSAFRDYSESCMEDALLCARI